MERFPLTEEELAWLINPERKRHITGPELQMLIQRGITLEEREFIRRLRDEPV